MAVEKDCRLWLSAKAQPGPIPAACGQRHADVAVERTFNGIDNESQIQM
jgi:hypothetical protein